MESNAKAFFEACESGKGWGNARSTVGRTLRAPGQTAALAEISTLQGYTDWMADVVQIMPSYESHCWG